VIDVFTADVFKFPENVTPAPATVTCPAPTCRTCNAVPIVRGVVAFVCTVTVTALAELTRKYSSVAVTLVAAVTVRIVITAAALVVSPVSLVFASDAIALISAASIVCPVALLVGTAIVENLSI
jgi:hypothetical protein